MSEQCSQYGWKHNSGSPLVWRELIDRGGKGLYLGGLQEFEHYASHYHGITPSTSQGSEEEIAKENQETLLSLKLEQENTPKISPLRVCVTNASSLTAYHLVQSIATGRVYGDNTAVAIHLYDRNAEKREELEGVALELVDLASPLLYEVRVVRSVKDAVDSVDMAFVLDYPYEQQVVREEVSKQQGDQETVKKDKPVEDIIVKDEGKEGESEKEVNTQNLLKEEPLSSRREAANDSSKLEDLTLPSNHDEEICRGELVTEPQTTTNKKDATIKDTESASLPLSELADDAPPTGPTTPPALVEAAQLYHCYGATMDFCSQKHVQVVVCGRYANTGAALMANAVTSIDKTNFIASPCLAELQAKAIIASKVKLNGAHVGQVAIWGRTCGDEVTSDLSHVLVKYFPGAVVGPDPYDLPLTRCIFQTEWLERKYHQLFDARHKHMEGYHGRNGCGSGVALVEATGLVQLTKQWREGTGSWWNSVGILATEEGGRVYGVPVGVVFSQPAWCSEGMWKPVSQLSVSEKIKVCTTRCVVFYKCLPVADHL